MPSSQHDSRPETGLRPVLGYRDLVLFFVVAVFTVRLVPLSASVGPSVVVLLLLAMLLFFVPLGVTVADLGSRYPDEGGIYVWSREAWGDFHGFLTAWAYWTANLAFFPSVLLFAASQSAFVLPGTAGLSEEPAFLTVVSVACVLVILLLNLVGLRVATWLHNLSGVLWIVPVVLILALGGLSALRFGSATDFAWTEWLPEVDGMKDVIFLATIAYLFAGFEGASALGDEVHEPRRTVPRALVTGGLAVLALYMATALGLLFALTPDELTGLGGFADAVYGSASRLGGEGFAQWARAATSLVLVLVSLGGVSVWFAATARLPFVIGLDRYLPAAFGRLHPTWRTPWVALVTLAVVTIVFVIMAGMGGTAAQVYNILVSLEIVILFVPYLYMFTALIRLFGRDVTEETLTVPGGRLGTWVVGGLGFVITLGSLALALVPGEEVADVGRFYAAVFGSLTLNLLAGVGLYAWGRRNRATSTDGSVAAEAAAG